LCFFVFSSNSAFNSVFSVFVYVRACVRPTVRGPTVEDGFVLVIALRPQTPKHIRGGWSHSTDTSEPVDGNGAQNMVTVQSGFEPATFRLLAHELTNCANRAHTM
jgi:hypothetical protein